MNQPKRIAIVGGGTAGLSAALRLRERGYDDVTVFEGSAQVGGKACSVQVDGRYYDLGGVVVVPQRYPNTWALARRYGLQTFLREPMLAVDLDTAEWTELEAAIEAAHSTRAYLSSAIKVRRYIKRYRKYFDKPGFSFNHCPELGWLRDELSLPLEQWVKKLQLAPLAAMWEPVVDMGYGPYSEVAALYFIYFRLCTPRHGIRSLLMQKLQGGAERLSFTLGAQSLATAMAKDCHVRTEVPVSRVARKHDGLWIYAGDGRELGTFDAVLLATPLDDAFDLLDASGASSALNNAITNTGAQVKREIRYADYYATIADGDGLPDASGYVSLGSQHLGLAGGHIGLRPWPQSPWWVFYYYGSPEQPGCQEAALGELHTQLKKVGVTLKTTVLTKAWPKFFPHVSQSAIANGFYDDLESLQGQGDIFYLGGALGFESLEHTITYSYGLVDQHFPAIRSGN